MSIEMRLDSTALDGDLKTIRIDTMIKASWLRKYSEDTSDNHCSIRSVVNSIYLVNQIEGKDNNQIKDILGDFNDGTPKHLDGVASSDGIAMTLKEVSELIRSELYGRILHSKYGRFVESEKVLDSYVVLRLWVHAIEDICQNLYNIIEENGWQVHNYVSIEANNIKSIQPNLNRNIGTS